MINRRIILPIALLLLTAVSAAGVELRDEVYATKDAGKVVFSHKTHLAQKDIRNNCKTCHNAIYDMKKRTRHTMAAMEEGKSCGACHNGKRAFSIDRCARCHEVRDVVFQVAATGPTKFSHKKHIAKRQCGACHPQLYKIGQSNITGMAAMEEGKSCGACHNGKEAFAIGKCSRCHPTKELKIAVKETGPVSFSHKKHVAVSRCENCHTKLYPTSGRNRVTMAEMEKGKSCGACHNGTGAFALQKCKGCHPMKEKVQFKAKWNAKFEHSPHLAKFSCQKCHPALYNPGPGNKTATMADMEKGRSCGACHNGNGVFKVTESCVQCHSA